LLPHGHDLDQALLLSNSGYCRSVLGDFNLGLKQLFKSLDLIHHKCALTWERFPCLGIAYAYLELDRLEQARVYAGRALRQSELSQSSEQVKNSLYLLGEAAKLAGDEDVAYEYFGRLQTEFYPNDAYISDFLMATDIRKLINLMA
jgi:tetratricopeptide (TPR) repeat protein